jgi:hypothetical protein
MRRWRSARLGRPPAGRTLHHGVGRIKEWIAAGDIYQVNLSQTFEAEVSGGSLFGLYESLRDARPRRWPHGFRSMAARCFVRRRKRFSKSPAAASRRGRSRAPARASRIPDEDLRSAYELQTSAKEIAELVMITDLLRNDLGQVCEFGSVQVSEMLRLESLAQVHHLVSTVTGTLRPKNRRHRRRWPPVSPAAASPARRKSAPWKSSASSEQTPRGIYCGAIGWLGYHGESSFNIAIRTLIREQGRPAHLSGRRGHRRGFRPRGGIRGNPPQSRRHPSGGGAVAYPRPGRAALTSGAATATVPPMDTMKLLLGATVALLLGALAVSWQGMRPA